MVKGLEWFKGLIGSIGSTIELVQGFDWFKGSIGLRVECDLTPPKHNLLNFIICQKIPILTLSVYNILHTSLLLVYQWPTPPR